MFARKNKEAESKQITVSNKYYRFNHQQKTKNQNLYPLG